VALLAFGALLAVGARGKGRESSKLGVAYRIALGIGLHNLTEGIGIAAPIARERPAWWHFVLLAALAGLPAVLGVWSGGFVYNALLAPLLSPATFGGLAAGVLIMYATALLVAA
jgi:ZIP family zinc transporter